MALPAHLKVSPIIREIATGKEHRFALYYTAEGGSTAPTASTIQSIANDFKTAFSTALPPCFTTAHAFSGVDAVYTGGGVQVDARSNIAESAGTVSGDVMPEEVAVLIQRRTGLQGRQRRGRVFIPCVPDSFVTGSALTSAALLVYKAVAEMMIGPVAAGSEETGWNPMQPSPTLSVLMPLTQTRVYSEVVSRRDRRFVKRGFVQAVVPEV